MAATPGSASWFDFVLAEVLIVPLIGIGLLCLLWPVHAETFKPAKVPCLPPADSQTKGLPGNDHHACPICTTTAISRSSLLRRIGPS
jgi:hypothetical protein